MKGFDYIIVGGGSAGCVLAARLSEDDAARVLMLEAGPRDTNPFIHMPVGFFKMTSGNLIWGYQTQPLKHANNRTAVYPQARVLGGGSSINAEIYTRGCPEDYDNWANEFDCDGWSATPALQDLTTAQTGHCAYRICQRQRDCHWPMCKAAWILACPTTPISTLAIRRVPAFIKPPHSMAAVAAPLLVI